MAETIGQTLAAAFAKYDPQRAVPKRKPSNEDYWRARLANQGSISKPDTTLGGLLGDALAGAARRVGASDRTAQRVSRRATAFLNDATPVGNALMAEEGGKQVKRGLTQGDLKQAAVGAGVFGLSMLPFAGKARKPLNSLMYDESGAIRAWHGSPHDFDKFSLDKIGTGEGAQAYGHGLYFAESPEVAKDYRRILTGTQREQERLERLIQRSTAYPRRDSAMARVPALEAKLAELQSKGRLYEVNINAEPEDFLDWDAPLVEQPEQVRQELLSRFGDDPAIGGAIRGDYGGARQYSGASLVSTLERLHSGRAPASGALRDLSLPGLKYLDQGSRGAGNGTRNYVVFDDKLIEILNKY